MKIKSSNISQTTKNNTQTTTPMQNNNSSLFISSVNELPSAFLQPNYDPLKQPIYPQNTPTPFGFLALCFDLISLDKSHIYKKYIINNLFNTILQLNPSDLKDTYNFVINKLAPDYIKIELGNIFIQGMGDGILLKAVSKSTGRSLQQLREAVVQQGDLGTVFSQSKKTQKTMDMFFKKVQKERLSIEKVMSQMLKISKCSGDKSEIEKEVLLMKILNDSEGSEGIYLVRFVQGNLKIGAAEASFQSALAKSFFNKLNKNNKMSEDIYNEKFEIFEKKMKQAYCEYPDQQEMISSLLEMDSISDLQKKMKITVGVPCKPMLAKPTKGISIIFKRFEGMKFTCEYKYDGLRGQIHYSQGKIKIFSRNLLDMTQTYPDIIDFFKQKIPENVSEFIMDTEIVAIDLKSNRILPFQTLTNRSKKNVVMSEIEIDVCLFMFDLLYLNGESYLQTPLEERRNAIKQNFTEIPGKLQYVSAKDTDDIEEIENLLAQSVKDGCEGLMVKTLDQNATYEPSKRSFKWLKLKKDYINNGLGDTLDLVPIGAFFGVGKRTGVYGSYLLACYNPQMERYESCCKTGTGFSEVQLEEFYQYFKDKIIKKPQIDYCVGSFECDVWFSASQVWEIRGADFQISPTYMCAKESLGGQKGLGIRFPRLQRIRDDKNPEEATTDDFIYDLYKQQAQVANQDFEDDNDMY